jgi:hypothetical protein
MILISISTIILVIATFGLRLYGNSTRIWLSINHRSGGFVGQLRCFFIKLFCSFFQSTLRGWRFYSNFIGLIFGLISILQYYVYI